MGSGPACWLAGNYDPAALCLMSPFASIRRLAYYHTKCLNVFVAERFENINEMDNLRCPLFILHGTRDIVIPYQHSQMLASAYADKEKLKHLEV